MSAGVASAIIELREALEGPGLGAHLRPQVGTVLDALEELAGKLQQYEGEAVIFTPAHCSSCGAEIRWVKMAQSNRLMPCNVKQRLVVTLEGRMVKGYESHFADCKNADKHRKAKQE